MKTINKPVLGIVLSMLIYGTIGIFRSFMPTVPSGVIAFARGAIGTLFLCAIMAIKHTKINFNIIKKHLRKLLISGVMLGFNWMLLFEAYRYTSVSIATLCYYMAPVFITLACPIFLGESINAKKILCITAAVIGMLFVSGVFDTETNISGIGITLGLVAAVLYAAIVILNKKTAEVGAYEKTFIQLSVSAIVMLPYTSLTENVLSISFTPDVITLLIIVGILHTGIAYTLYFGSIGRVKAQTAALLSYIDPVSAIILSAIILNENMTVSGIVGSVLILGSAIVSETGSDS